MVPVTGALAAVATLAAAVPIACRKELGVVIYHVTLARAVPIAITVAGAVPIPVPVTGTLAAVATLAVAVARQKKAGIVIYHVTLAGAVPVMVPVSIAIAILIGSQRKAHAAKKYEKKCKTTFHHFRHEKISFF